VYESSGKLDASRSLFEQARELYAKCKVQAGVTECDEK
jgi:exonuclease VII small subunit